MGIPKFFRWLTRRYPMILQNVSQLEDVPPVDNLYLDLNGIVHNAIHGNDPKRHERISKLDDLEELWAAIMRAIDELVHVVKPKKVLFLAVDGVAPRAKMNQQRARRFKSAKEREMLTNQLRSQGKNVPEMFDTNAISPGTEFMVNLCTQLHFFLKYKLNTDPLYQNLKECVISDGHVPGEGEHKMLDYIRKARSKTDYDPNTRHCFYGADADLIMLSLLTHEPHFTIIREEHVVKKHINGGVQRVELSMTNQFQLIHISLLREYFQLEYSDLVGKLRIPWNLERIIDDFIFFCFFIGNDFLPNISALDIAEGSLDKLIDLYKLILPSMDDYITFQGVINWERAEKLIWVLGEHEDEVFRERLDQSKSRRDDFRTISVTQDMNPLSEDHHARGTRSLQTYNLFKEKIYQKKVQKVTKLKAQGHGKKYKKFLISKMFKEDAEDKVKIPKEAREFLIAKFNKLFNEGIEVSVVEETKEVKKSIEVIVQEIDEQYFSDLRAEDIPDDCVSDVGDNVNAESLETLEQAAAKGQQDSITNAAAEMVKAAEDANMRFMNEFVKLYAQDPLAARAKYYLEKVHIDINTDEGKYFRKRMMKKYIEGIQWVLFYYYRGAQHWRWYYPFHYAPLIGDFGIDLVKDFLGGNPKISKFEVDYNCPEEIEPYTPFQQLLAIMPIRSFKLLPECYRKIATNELQEFFPDDFSVDLNGKALAWEAIVLIPFVDQAIFLEMEAKMLSSGQGSLSKKEQDRNKWTFCYHNYTYSAQNQSAGPLPSTLTGLKPIPHDHSKCEINYEYQHVGEQSFTPIVMQGCVRPAVGYPSFMQLNVSQVTMETILVRKVQFKKVLVRIPQCIEETQPEKLEEYLWKITKQHNKSVYIDLPYLHEAFPMFFEDQFTCYTLFVDETNNTSTIYQQPQTKSLNEWEGLVKRVRYNLSEKGIDCPADTTNVLVTCNRVQGVQFSSEYDNHYFYKAYEERTEILPLSLLVRRRDPHHYLNVDARCKALEHDMPHGSQVIFLKNNLFGVMGRLEAVDARKQLVKLSIDKQAEESKVHDPFMGEKHLRHLHKSNAAQVETAQAFFGETDIDMMLNFKPGTTARITSSFMLTYKDPKSKEKCMVDIGLNLKNWTKQMHVAGYVRFTQGGDHVAVNQFDDYNHNNFARGAKHVRAHWEYSGAAVDMLKEYLEKFPEVFKMIGQNLKKNTNMPQLKDLYGSNDQGSVDKIKQILIWINSMPASHLPFVDMGFDALTPEMIKSLSKHRETIQTDFKSCDLIQKPIEWAKTSQVFVERFPFWVSPFPKTDIAKYHIGDRVININSTQRMYIPFGLRGTVVGKSQKQVLICFDQQFLQGSDVNGHCEMYRGAMVDPDNLVNITRKFRKQVQDKNQELVDKFTEVDPQNPEKCAYAEITHQHQEQQPVQEKKQEKPKQQAKQANPIVQKQASTGYAQQSYYKAKSYQPMQQVAQHQPTQQVSQPMYQPKTQQTAQPMFQPRPKLQETNESQIQVVLSQDPAISIPVESKQTMFADPAISTITTEVSSGSLPQLSFAGLKTDLGTSPEFAKLLQEMNQPEKLEDMLNVLGSLMGQTKDASSTSQVMMDPAASPFVPAKKPDDQVKPE